MDKRNPTELVQTFLEEHRTLMRGLSGILQKVESEDFIGARKQADELDQMAGPHIQFEEEVLYPEVGRSQGRELERQLRDEHSTIRCAIQRLSQVDEAQASDPRFRAELAIALRTAIRHVVPAHRQLFFVERKGIHDREICGIPHVRHESSTKYRALVVASEPISHEYWREIPNQTIVTASKVGGMNIHPVTQHNSTSPRGELFLRT